MVEEQLHVVGVHVRTGDAAFDAVATLDSEGVTDREV